MRALGACTTAACLWVASAAAAEPFAHNPVGMLTPGSGQGRTDSLVYAPDIRFPIANAPAFANSQVYGHGGSKGPGGGQCDAGNFRYPWWDNFCETRGTSSWSTPLCPDQSGGHHYGQDIRAASCDKHMHGVVSSTDGTVTKIGTYSVNITTDDGRRFQYLHMDDIQVTEGQRVTMGQPIGNVGDAFGGTPTTVHLHWAITANVDGVGQTYVPPYTTLVESYRDLVGDPEDTHGEGVGPDAGDIGFDAGAKFDANLERPVATGCAVRATTRSRDGGSAAWLLLAAVAVVTGRATRRALRGPARAASR